MWEGTGRSFLPWRALQILQEPLPSFALELHAYFWRFLAWRRGKSDPFEPRPRDDPSSGDTVISHSQKNWSDLSLSVSPPSEDGVSGRNQEETMSSELPILDFNELHFHSISRTQRHLGESSHKTQLLLCPQVLQAIPCDKEPEQLDRNYTVDGRRKEKEEEEESRQECWEGCRQGSACESPKFNSLHSLGPRIPSGTTPEHKADVTQNCKEKRKREMAVEHEDQRKAEEETEEQPTCKKQVSKPLLDTLWTKFKANEGFTARDSFALAFQFDLTAKQVHQWFCNMRQEYKKEIRKLKYKKRYRNKRKTSSNPKERR